MSKWRNQKLKDNLNRYIDRVIELSQLVDEQKIGWRGSQLLYAWIDRDYRTHNKLINQIGELS